MKPLVKAFASLVFFLLTCSSHAVADPIVIAESDGSDHLWKVTVTNNTGMTVVGVHLNFTGTGGTIHDPMVVMNAPGAGNASIIVTNSGSAVDVTWANPPGLPAGGTFMIQFSTNFVATPVVFNDGFWFPGEKPVDTVNVQEIPEPVTLLLLATGLAGVAINTRKQLKGSGD